MADSLSWFDFQNFLVELSRRVVQSKNQLDSMDAACGDGDFGSTIAAAFERAATALKDAPANGVGTLLTSYGSTILSTAGGASGPIFGALFVEAGKAVKGKTEVSPQDLALMFGASLKRIQQLGGAVLGDKTAVDSLEPALRSLQKTAQASLREALEQAARASETGCESTKHLIAKHGKARYLGEQTIGSVDPGAYLVSLLFDVLATTTKPS